MSSDAAGDLNAAREAIAFGGPADGTALRGVAYLRHWVVRLPASTAEEVIPGDHALGQALYSVMRERPTWSTIAIVRGCYHRPRASTPSSRYLDLFVAPGTDDQRYYFELARFLGLYVMLLRHNEWTLRRPDRRLATRVLSEAQRRDDSELFDLAVMYLSCLVLEDDEDPE